MFASMDPIILLLLVASLFIHPFFLVAQPINPTSRITVAGVVYCDVCATNTFSRHSYFLPGVDVHIQCNFKASSPKTTEQISFSVNRTTDRSGVYMLEISSVEGVDCVEGHAIESSCEASLIGSSFPGCNVPRLTTTSDEIIVKSKQDSLCIYSLSALSYKQSEINATLCTNQKKEVFPTSLNSSKFFLPYFPPFVFPWPPLPQLPPFPTFPFPPCPWFQFPPLPPYPSLPFPPPLPPIPYFFPPPQLPKPPSLPFPFPPLPPLPQLPPFPPTPSLPLPPPPQAPGFNLGDPRTWTPYIPSPPPPPALTLGDPRTWIPNVPTFSPPPPAFNLGDPRTWIPYLPPTPPNSPQSQNP